MGLVGWDEGPKEVGMVQGRRGGGGGDWGRGGPDLS